MDVRSDSDNEVPSGGPSIDEPLLRLRPELRDLAVGEELLEVDPRQQLAARLSRAEATRLLRELDAAKVDAPSTSPVAEVQPSFDYDARSEYRDGLMRMFSGRRASRDFALDGVLGARFTNELEALKVVCGQANVDLRMGLCEVATSHGIFNGSDHAVFTLVFTATREARARPLRTSSTIYTKVLVDVNNQRLSSPCGTGPFASLDTEDGVAKFLAFQLNELRSDLNKSSRTDALELQAQIDRAIEAWNADREARGRSGLSADAMTTARS